MKQWLFGALLACESAYAQPRIPGREPEAADSREGATVIAVLLADSGAVAWTHMAHVLEEHGYRVASREALGLRLVTAPVRAGNGQCSAAIHVTVMGHVALLSGLAFCELLHGRPRPLNYSRYSHMPFGNYDCTAWGWTQVERLAWALPGKKVSRFHLP